MHIRSIPVLAAGLLLAAPDLAHARSPVAQPGEIAAAEAAGFDPVALAGAKAMGLSPTFVVEVRSGLELLYLRKYDAFRQLFHAMDSRWEGTGVGPVSDVLAWQAIMLENFDYRHEAAWQTASAEARTALESAAKQPGNEAWEQFMLVGVSGIESIHAARRGKYVGALTLAFEAIDHISATRAAAPDFVDIRLGDGLYNYWRTVITDASALLPSFGDQRQEGIAQMQEVERDGVFVAPAATLSLAYVWFEEDDDDKLVAACLRNHDRYPDNIINELMLGIAYMTANEREKALATFDRVMAIDPSNIRVVYWRGRTLQKMRKFDAAEAEYQRYLAMDGLEQEHRAWTLYRLGQLHEAQKDYEVAMAHYREAVKAGGHKAAKSGIDRVRKKARGG